MRTLGHFAKKAKLSVRYLIVRKEFVRDAAVKFDAPFS